MNSYFSTSNGSLYLDHNLEVMESIPVESVNAVITDPPYSSGGLHRKDRTRPANEKYSAKSGYSGWSGETMDQRSYYRWSCEWLQAAHRCLVQGGVIAAFIDWRQLPILTDAMQASDFLWRGIFVWDKGNSRPVKGGCRNQCEYVIWGTKGSKIAGDAYLPGCIRTGIVQAKKRLHLCEKPLPLMRELIRFAPEGGTVLDPFAGSGVTLLACEDTNRKWIGIERDPEYCRRIEARFEINLLLKKELT